MTKNIKKIVQTIKSPRTRHKIIFYYVRITELTKSPPLCTMCEDYHFMGKIAWGRPLTVDELNLNITLARAGELYLCQEDQKYMPKDKHKPTKICELLEDQEGETENNPSFDELVENDKKFIQSNQQAILAHCKGCHTLKFDKDYNAYVCGGKKTTEKCVE